MHFTAILLLVAATLPAARCAALLSADNTPAQVQALFRDAITAGDVDRVRFLASHPDLRVDEFRTQFARAAGNGHAVIVAALLEDPRVSQDAVDRALEYAVASGHLEIVRLLLGRASEYQVNSVLSQAVGHDHAAVFALLEADPRVQPYGLQRAYLNAVCAGNLALTRRLLQKPGVDPAYQGSVALLYATRNNRYDLAALLLSQPGIDPREGEYLHPDPANPEERAAAVRLLGIAREFWGNTLEQFRAKEAVLAGLSPEERAMLLSANRDNMGIFLFLLGLGENAPTHDR
jgi:ankyrin repeat protein